jgi:hypothetical protein
VILLAAIGREPPDATLVWSSAGQDRSAALASGAGEPPNSLDFSDETGGEKEKCWRHRSKQRWFRSLALSGAVKLAPSVGAGGSERWKSDRPLLRQAGRRILPVDPEVKTEIPDIMRRRLRRNRRSRSRVSYRNPSEVSPGAESGEV